MKKAILMMTAVFCSGLLLAQDQQTANLDEVSVTASKTPLKQNQTGKVVTIIDQATLQRNLDKSLTEILNTQAAIFTAGANNTLGSNQELYFRGSATGNTLILIDGIPINDPSQNSSAPIDINNINIGQIEQIEILKGSQSTLWGSNAMAGVINIITKKGGTEKIMPNAHLSYGSYQTFRGNVGIRGTVDHFDYNIAYNQINSKGFSAAYDSTKSGNFDRDGFNQNNIQANLGYKISDRLSAAYMGMYSKYKADGDAGAFTDDRDYRINSKNLINTLKLQYKHTQTSVTLSQSIISSERAYTDDSAHVGGFAKWSHGLYNGRSYITDLFGNYYFSGHVSLLAGLQYSAINTDQQYKSISSFGPYEALPLGKDSAKFNNFAGYISLLLLDLKGFNNEMGVRINNNSKYGSNATFSFNPSYNVSTNTKVFVNISSGFREPSLYQLYGEYRNKTTELKPEKSINYEAGVQTNFDEGKSWFRMVGFKRDIKDLIIYYTDAATFESYYMNQNEQHDYGFEMESSIAIGRIGSFSNNLSYVDGQGKNNTGTINNLYRRPNFIFNSSLVLTPITNLTVNPAFRFVGNRLKGEFDAGAPVLPHYYTLDFYASYAFTPKIKIYTDFRNLTDQVYFDTPGYNAKRFNFMGGLLLNL
ncbi:MAG: TonB-dependent receptor [Niabella sp.]|nr:TonB-dependent receptor [Niabella sp.]